MRPHRSRRPRRPGRAQEPRQLEAGRSEELERELEAQETQAEREAVRRVRHLAGLSAVQHGRPRRLLAGQEDGGGGDVQGRRREGPGGERRHQQLGGYLPVRRAAALEIHTGSKGGFTGIIQTNDRYYYDIQSIYR